MVNIIILLISISVLVLIHEIGHFLMARKFGIWVEEFGLGLPPRLFSKKIGETVYSINAIPMGGFVKLHGEEEEALKHHKIKKAKRAFFNRPWWQRSLILTAGVMMNFLFAFLVISFLFTKGVTVPDKVEIGEIAKNSPAENAGFIKGDLILKIDNTQVSDITEVIKKVGQKLEKETVFEIQREERHLILKAIPRKNPPQGEGALGVVLAQKVKTEKYPFYSAWYYGLKTSFKMSLMLLQAIITVFWDLFSAFKVPQDVAGPIGMYQLYGEARKYGFLAILELSGLISLNLAVMNLFPLPPLDGARLMFVLVERFTGKKLKKEWEHKMYQVSFFILIILFVLISIQDIRRLLNI